MKDNRIIRVLRALRDHAIGKTETYWNGLNARQRKRIVYGLLASTVWGVLYYFLRPFI